MKMPPAHLAALKAAIEPLDTPDRRETPLGVAVCVTANIATRTCVRLLGELVSAKET